MSFRFWLPIFLQLLDQLLYRLLRILFDAHHEPSDALQRLGELAVGSVEPGVNGLGSLGGQREQFGFFFGGLGASGFQR